MHRICCEYNALKSTVSFLNIINNFLYIYRSLRTIVYVIHLMLCI